MKKLLLLKSLFLLCALVVGSGSVWAQSNYANDHTGNVTLSTSGGTNASTFTVNISSTNYSAIKLGNSKNAGSFNITAPAGTKYLHIHVAGWKGDSPSLTVKNGETQIGSDISLTQDNALAGSISSATLSGTLSDYYKVVTLTTALASPTSLTISTTSKRAVVWGITAEIVPTAVSLDKSSATIGVSGTVTLTPTFTPLTTTNKNLTWTTDDSSIATVSNGVVTGVAEGNTTITATHPVYGTVTASCEITVEASKPVTGVSLNKTSTSISVGENETLEAIIAPANATIKTVTWSSDDNDIATVDTDGKVTGVAAGTTKIWVETTDGGFKASCDVTITNVDVTGVSLNVTSASIKEGKTITLTPTVAPSNATVKTVSWSSDDEDVATVAGGVVTGVAAGTTKIWVETTDGGYKASCDVTVLEAGDGSSSKPYSPSEVRALSSGTYNDKYVKGYILGVADGSGTTFNFKEPGASENSNWVIADSKDETDGEKMIPVQISGASTQTTYGLGNHKDLIGAEVLVYGDLVYYFGVYYGVKNLESITAKKEVTVSTSNYATYACTNALDFSGTDVKAYTAAVSGNKVVLSQVDNVPANTGVVLYCATPGNYNVPVIASASAVSDNELIGVTTKTPVTWQSDGKYNYILQGGVFKKASSGNLKANRAYLHTSYDVTAAAAREYLEFAFEDDNETTAVNEITNTNLTNNTNEVFDLQGRKVAQPTKGLYIVNGKKVVIK